MADLKTSTIQLKITEQIKKLKNKQMKRIIHSLIALSLAATTVRVSAQAFSTAEYKKATWMTTRFYGAQRSSDSTKIPTNWLLQNHGTGYDFYSDNDNGYNVSGGWSDCGDNVRFGQTQYYSAYVLLKGFDVWPTGYPDYYSQNYKAYNAAQDYSWEGAHHDPDGIPDILNEVKYATDYFILCARNDSTFYQQVGEGDLDHKLWITTVQKAKESTENGGSPRHVFKNPDDASMPSFCGATLALMSVKYRQIDSKYSDICLAHALYAYNYAKKHKSTEGSPDGSFYGSNSKWQDDFATLCTELYYATKDEKYKTEALSYEGDLSNHYYCFDYSNNDDIAAYNLATLGSTVAAELLSSFASSYTNFVDANGIYQGGNTEWGSLRYLANASFIVALNNTYNKISGVDPFIYKQLDFIMGDNAISSQYVSSNLSFIVGMEKNSVRYPHHRNVYLNDSNVTNETIIDIPKRNAEFGYLAGGVRNGTYDDTRNNYQVAEGGIDYNACLVGSLAYILAQTASVKPQTMSLSTNAISVYLSNTKQVKVSFEPANSYCDMKWTSRNNKIATVDFNGIVTGTGVGSTYVIAKSVNGQFIDSTLCIVSLINVTGVSVAPINMLEGEKITATVNITPTNASVKDVFWTSSDTTIATVSNNGIVTALTVGQVTITAKSVNSSYKGSNTVSISANPKLINVLKTSKSPIIDGEVNESMWTLADTISKVSSGKQNNTEAFGLLWDDTYLYCGIKVTDATIVNTNIYPFYNDAVELFFDIQSDRDVFSEADRLFLLAAGASDIIEIAGKSKDVTFATKINDNGYSMEIAIPWSNFPIKPNTSSIYGFDIAVDDADNTTSGKRDNQVMWVGNANNYNTLSNIGYMHLSNDSANVHSTGVEAIEMFNVAISPNPARHSFVVKNTGSANMKVSVYDVLGKIIKQKSGSADILFDCSELQSGMYFLRIEANNQIITKSIVIEK